ncbi:LacI family DNA-binding transcriptional regulator [uncultured Clostridium sp.]|uniref:LacI family DNA-binding transcriptional regulator n=1 Tax=uncultured Clostridium sp. TaxID=59620 RepID=UPI00258F5581|nr:LacI family DNA-binding transcriptional regulator [uncultured Clostridium sp.]
MASINDVAKLAMVSKSTVSLVVNNKGYVSEETRSKVEKAMKELNYIPSQLARNFSAQKSGIVGIVMPDVMHPFFSTFIKYAERYLYEKGYNAMVCGTVGREMIEETYLNMLNRHVMDGIIMGVHTLDVEKYKETTRPIVTLDRFIDADIPMVSSNHKQAAEITTKVLKDRNCKRVVQIIGSKLANTPTGDYAKYCRMFLEENNIEVCNVETESNSFTIEGYEKAAEKVFKNHPNIDAIIGVDIVILLCLKLALKKGYEVPKDLKLISYDGTYITRLGEKTITSIVQPIESLAKESVKKIIQLIEDKEIENKKSLLDVSLQAGETT